LFLTMFYQLAIIVLFFGVVSLADNLQQLTVDVLENGAIFRQRTTFIGEDLQIIEMPNHGVFLAMVAYLDFKNSLELTKYVNEQYCQLSKLDVKTTPPLSKVPKHRQAPGDVLDLNQMKKTRLVKLQSSEPMTNTSFLRAELQAACNGLPIYWATTTTQDVFDYQQQQMVIEGERYLRSPLLGRQGNDWECAWKTNPIPTPSKNFCSNDCRWQICGPHIGATCYYYVHCKEDEPIGSWCYNHVTNHASRCALCCGDPRYGCRAQGWTGTQHCKCY
jgi:hypothetical protein